MKGLQLKNGHYGIGIFDFDGNVLQTDPIMYFQNKETKKIEEFPASFVYSNKDTFFEEDSKYKIISSTFSHTSDVHFSKDHRGFDGLKEDVQYSLDKNGFAPSFEMLKKKFLIRGRLFALLTARSNSPDNFERIFFLINETALTAEEKKKQHKNIIKNYNLDSDISKEEALGFYFKKVCLFIPCNNPHVARFLSIEDMAGGKRKAHSIDFILEHFLKILEIISKKDRKDIFSDKHNVSIGFSDDTVENIFEVTKKFQVLQKKKLLKKAKFVSYFTGHKQEYKTILEYESFIGKITPRFDNQSNNQALLRIKLNNN